MTDQELNKWERQNDVVKVLISKEFGAWLNRRDKNKQKKGEWIEHENPKDVFSIECSECGCWFLHEHLVRNSFCPNCGADMRNILPKP